MPPATAPTPVSTPPTHKEDPILSPAEVARRIGKSGPTVIEWIKSGLLRAIWMHGRWGVRTSEVNKLLEASEIKGRV